MTPLTILHINTERGFRGGEIQNLYLAAGLVERGHRCILALQEGSPLAARAEERGLTVREHAMRGEFDPLAVSWLAGIIQEERPHLVHCHTSHAVTLSTLARFKRPSPPSVATRRTSFPTRRNPLFRLKFSYRVDHVIAVSGSIRDDLVAAGLPTDRVSVVHSGIDLTRFCSPEGAAEFRGELDVPPDHLLLGCVGALAPQKAHEILLRVTARLMVEFHTLHLALVGEGELHDQLLDESRNLGIGDRVHLAGFRDDIPAATAAFDLAALPSVAGEGSPAVVKEAMACGVPIVATAIGGVQEILEDRVQGRLVPPGDEEALGSALRDLLRDPELRAKLGQAGQRRARMFSMDRMIEQTEAIYTRLCHAEVPGEAP
jgi:L-malate glycosyltransferase